MLYYEEPSATLYQGHAIDVLKELPSESVDCVMTSPPYWGLRTYKTEPIIWGDNNCGHEWGKVPDKVSRWAKELATDCKQATEGGTIAIVPQGDFCLKCGAWKGELGLEPTIELYISHLLQIFDEVKRVLKKTGTCWVNIGDSYTSTAQGTMNAPSTKIHSGEASTARVNYRPFTGVPIKSLCLIPERFALGMVDRGWILRNVIIWYKSNPMPESVKDRFTGAYEYLYFFTKAQRYWFEQQFEKADYDGRHQTVAVACSKHTEDNPMASREYERWPVMIDGVRGRNKRDVWEINTQPYPEAHFATFPEKLVETPILSGCPQDGTVLDPLAGSGTVGTVAKRLGRKYIGIELSDKYCKLHKKRLQAVPLAMELI